MTAVRSPAAVLGLGAFLVVAMACGESRGATATAEHSVAEQSATQRPSSEVVAQQLVSRQSETTLSADGVAPDTLVTLWIQINTGEPVESVDVSGGGIAWERAGDASAGDKRIFMVFAGSGADPGGPVAVHWGAGGRSSGVVTMIQHRGRTTTGEVTALTWRDGARPGRANAATLSLSEPPQGGGKWLAGVVVGDRGVTVSPAPGCVELAESFSRRGISSRVEECPSGPASWSWDGAPVHWMALGLEIR